MSQGVWQQDENGRSVIRLPLPSALMGRSGEATDTSRPMLIAWLAMLAFGQIFRTTFLIRQRDREDYGSLDLYNLINVGLVGLTLLTFALSPRIQKRLGEIWQSPLRWFLIYYGLAGLTFLYASSMVFAVYRSLEMMTNITLAGLIMLMAPSQDAARRFLVWGSLLAICSNFAWHVLSFGLTPTGIKSNNYPVVAVLGLLFCIGTIQSGQKTKWFYPKLLLPAFFFFWTAGTSSASMISGLFGYGVMMMVSKRGNVNVVGIILLGAAAYIFATFFAEPVMQFLFPGKDLENIESMSGRMAMWQGYLQGIMERPIQGWGFPTGEKEYLRMAFDRIVVMSAHNSLISVAINTGLVGLGVFLIAMFDTARWSFRGAALQHPEARVLMAVLAAAYLNSMSYPVIGSHWFWTSTFFFGYVAYGAFYVWQPRQPVGAGGWGRITLRWTTARDNDSPPPTGPPVT